MRKFILMAVSLISVIMIFISCKRSPIEIEDTTPPGRHDYEWTVDTVRGFNPLTQVYASSLDDIWAVNGDLWHYDGVNWAEVKEHLWPNAIFGISKDDIWCGAQQRIWHFNGKKWDVLVDFNMPKYPHSFINEIWGNNANELYVTGCTDINSSGPPETLIMTNANGKWERLNFRIANENAFQTREINGELLILTVSDLSGFNYCMKLYSFSNNSVRELISTDYALNIQKFNGKIIVNIDKKVYEYFNKTLTVVADLTKTNYIGGLWGRSEKDFFCALWPGKIGHYNGKELYTFDELSGLQFGICFIEDAAIVNMYNPAIGANLICKGRLRKE